MSLYNLVRGVNPNAGICLGMLGVFKPSGVPRFRDAWLSDDGTRITLLTRTGGNNREDYTEENEKLKLLPGYMMDIDDDFDGTFARWIYSVSEEYREHTANLAALMLHTNSGEATQGPGPMVDAMLEQYGEKPAKPKDQQPSAIGKDHPIAIKALQSFDALVALIKAKMSPVAPEAQDGPA